jgi:hypothetical protein
MRSRRSGIALIYVAVTAATLMGVCSLAVDLGRYHTAHQELYNAAMAAARAGAAAMSNGSASAVTTAATNAAKLNYIDGQTVPAGDVTVEFLNWTSPASYVVESSANFASANAVRVTITYNVPLVFGQVLGLNQKSASEASVAKVVVNTDTPTVYATGNIWLSNEPNGTTASQPDPGYAGKNVTEDHQYQYDIAGTPGKNTHGASSSTGTYGTYQPYSSPAKVGFSVTPGATITISNVGGSVSWDHDTTPWSDATGNGATTGNYSNAAANGVSEHGIADLTQPLGSMNAVFTGSSAPDGIATPPAPLDFSTAAARNYTGLAPKLQQPFYVGTGQNSNSQQQQIVVPQGATYLFIGIMDGWEWSNNNGTFTCTVTQTYITTVQ